TDHGRRRSSLERTMANGAQQDAGSLDAYFARSRSTMLLTAHDPSFRAYFTKPASRRANLAGVKRALRYLEALYPNSIAEASFAAADGRELARVVRGRATPARALSPDETG